MRIPGEMRDSENASRRNPLKTPIQAAKKRRQRIPVPLCSTTSVFACPNAPCPHMLLTDC